MVARPADYLGVGLYTPSEAARYARIASGTMTRWLGLQTDRRRVFSQQLETAEHFVTFLDFVQALAIHDIRQQHRVSLNKIRDAVSKAEKKGFKHPFARRHCAFLYNGEILIQYPPDENPTWVTGKSADQMAMKPILQLYLRDLSFDKDGLADAYTAFRWHQVEVVMNPEVRFGEPLVGDTGYTALALAEACISEGGIEQAAKAYGVDVEHVEAAFRYFDFLQGKSPA